MKKTYTVIFFSLFIFMVISGYYVYKYKNIPQKPEFERLILNSHNWEAASSKITIEKDGAYKIENTRFGRTDTRSGKTKEEEFKKLKDALIGPDIFSLSNEYTGPKKTSKSWIEYILTADFKGISKSIKFHSEDENIPKNLSEIAETIEQITNE